MAGRAPWQDGRRAWARLNGWHERDPRAVSGQQGYGDAALKALADVHLVRSLLERAELVAVMTARNNGKSWTEIATMLDMTRQSAWERWHEADIATSDSSPSD